MAFFATAQHLLHRESEYSHSVQVGSQCEKNECVTYNKWNAHGASSMDLNKCLANIGSIELSMRRLMTVIQAQEFKALVLAYQSRIASVEERAAIVARQTQVAVYIERLKTQFGILIAELETLYQCINKPKTRPCPAARPTAGKLWTPSGMITVDQPSMRHRARRRPKRGLRN